MEELVVPLIVAATIIFLFYYFYKFTPLQVSVSVVLLSMVATIIVGIGESLGYPMYEYLGFNPAVIALRPWTIYTVITSIFVHGGFLHWLFNSLVLMFLCSYFEYLVGKRNFMKVFIFSAITADLVHLIITLTIFRSIYGPVVTSAMLRVTLVGASGAIFGVLAAYAILFPTHRVTMFVGFIPLPGVPIYFAVMITLLFELMAIIYQPFSTIAHTAHVGGAIGGIIYAYYIHERRSVIPKRVFPRSRRYSSRRASLWPIKKEYRFDVLRKFVYSPYDEELLQRAIDDEEYRDYWISRLINNKPCPVCGFSLEYDDIDGVVRCINCGYEVRIRE